MIIGTVRSDEARVFDSHAGFHLFHVEETQEPYGSFEVFWHDSNLWPEMVDEEGNPLPAGWYWWACFPGCLSDGEPSGPFASSQLAHKDADEWSPEYDDDDDRKD